ncbi:MAG: hypothetical protein PHH06_03015 [Candidatus Gracilibacteria bacterium]|nr:hypothetical protein [Candidatus Gracilibacteria bacterium]
MSLEDYIPDIESSEGGGQSAEAIKEISEKFKESVKKGAAGIKRTQKDEKKAKAQDMLLANFLVKLILDKKYDPLLNSLFSSLSKGFSSNFLLGVMSLVYIDISHKIREFSGKQQIDFSYKSPELVTFDDAHLPIPIKNRINSWVEDMIDSVSINYSHIQTEKLLELLKTDESIIKFISLVFAFFLREVNITITESKAESIIAFILTEVYKSLEKLEIEEV